ncbi:WD40-repeat-containing domain protein [Clohesyomyces aquaticus]|uniref:WD40-repeat-containing domain protein n=1 Tax=Clohesyomyces aquaticus TaxID=1231657 RepID=A0A1Y1YBN6_9PLEO|nr:WD40-repeat-containing domain protein [Clohesyomyces aquaticus]
MAKVQRECVQDIHSTDPRDDKKRIEYAKGGLLKASRLLWIKGDPGKGKTMLICGIIDELQQLIAKTGLVSYFFSVLRGLLFLLVSQQPLLIAYVWKKYDHAGKTMFEDANAWVALTEIFTDVLRDPSLNATYLIIDALDECVTDLLKLLAFVVKHSSESSRVKWIISSRNWLDIEEQLERAGHKVRLSLELNAESVSTAVRTFIEQKHLASNANDTFLWVALVCQSLEMTAKRNVLKKLNLFPPRLDSLYKRMMQQISKLDDAELCKQVLASIALVYRPITLKELVALVEQLGEIVDDKELREIIGLCGSFLILRENTIYFGSEVFLSGRQDVHHTIVARSLEIMSRTLQRDMYGLKALGYPIDDIKQPDSDPLATSRYSCVYWIDHLCDWNPSSSAKYEIDLQDGGAVDSFLRQQYLYWLEALSVCKSMSQGVVSIAKLEVFMQWYASALLFSPTRSLIRSLFKREELNWITIAPAMEEKWSACLQTLEGHSGSVNSVVFSPDSTRLASGSSDKTVKIWDASSGACLSTLKGHSSIVYLVVFSPDSTRLASGSSDKTVKIWDASSGACLSTLKGHSSIVYSVVFSPDSTRLASGSWDNMVKTWDASSGACLLTLKGHSDCVCSVVFSPDSTRLASGSSDKTVKIWDASSGACLSTLKGHSSIVYSVVFSPDLTRLASGSSDKTVKIWDASSGACLSTLKGDSSIVYLVVFSPDSSRLASGSYDATVKIWDASSGACLSTLKGHSDCVYLVVFSPDSTRLASGSSDKTTLEGHSGSVNSVVFSPDSTRLASGSSDNTVKIWDASSGAYLLTLMGHSDSVYSVVFSPDSTRLASGSYDRTDYQGLGISSDCMWITYDSENVLWLPSEYQSSRFIVSKNRIGIGTSHGRRPGDQHKYTVWICHSEASSTPCGFATSASSN